MLVEAMEDTVFPPSISSSENALDIPESVDTASTADPENPLAVRVEDWCTFGGVFEQLLKKN